MADKTWIPVDVYFLSNGFPFTHERTEMVEERLARMGYRLRDPESFMEVHERIMSRFYAWKDTVHIQTKYYKKRKPKEG